jgi:hypothetical protein
MSGLFNLMISAYRRRKLSENLFFKLGMGCLSLLFLAICGSTCLLLLLWVQFPGN